MSEARRSFEKTDEDQLAGLLEQRRAAAEKAIQNFFIALVAQLTGTVNVAAVLRWLNTMQFQDVFDKATIAGMGLAGRVNEAYVAGAQAVVEYLQNRLAITIGFDQVNERAVAALRNNNLRFTDQISETVRYAIRTVLIDHVEAGLNPVEAARSIRRYIGLTPKQIQMVENYRRNLQELSSRALSRQLRDKRSDSLVGRAIETQTPMSDEVIDSLVDRYRNRFIAYRAKVIARTEALRAVHEGSAEMTLQALQSGLFKEEEVQQEWITARDERVRGSHKTMHGQKRPLGVPFLSGNGAALRYPGDPAAPLNEITQCRCLVTVRIVSE